MIPILLRRKDLLDFLKVSPATLWRWRQTQNFPKPIKLSEHTPAWKLAEIEAWLKEQQDAEHQQS